MANQDIIRGRQVILTKTNRSGGAVNEGDVVIIDIANDESFTTTVVVGSLLVQGVVQEDIANLAVGRVLVEGRAAIVEVNDATARGDFLKTSGVATRATSQATMDAGVFARAETATVGAGQVVAELFGVDGGGAGGGAPVGAEYIVGAADAGLTAEVVREWLADNEDQRTYPAAPDALDDEFEGAGAIDVKWTKTNDPAGGDALSQAIHEGFLFVGLAEDAVATFASSVRLHQTPPAGTQTMEYVIRVSIVSDGALGGNLAEWGMAGVYLGDSANSEIVGCGLELNDAIVDDAIRTVAYKGHGTAMDAVGNQLCNPPGRFVYVKLSKTTASAYTAANTYKAYVSANGMVWHLIGEQVLTFTALCDEVGIYFRNPKVQVGTAKAYPLIDFFRRVA